MRMASKRALITGIFGQDGSYLAELLHEMGYEIHGVEKEPLQQHALLLQDHLKQKNITFVLHSCDLRSYKAVKCLMRELRLDECYHLATVHYPSEAVAIARNRVDKTMFDDNVAYTLNLLYAIQEVSPYTKFVLAGSCLMFDAVEECPQNENTCYKSKSVYGLSKIACSEIVTLLRNTKGLHCSTAILYNHESPRRTDKFVTKKIVKNLVKIKNGELSQFTLGNLKGVRDWGYAKDYVRGMWLMCQQPNARDYILATGMKHTVEDFVLSAARILNVSSWQNCVSEDRSLLSSSENVVLIGNASMAERELNWRVSVEFDELVRIMVMGELNKSFD
jgi:GDPmannose 4,6-dehydratase